MPAAPPARWGLGEAAVAFLVGLTASAQFAGLVQSATGVPAGQNKPIPLAVSLASLTGLWIGLGGGAVYVSRRNGSGSLARDFGFRLRWPSDVGIGVVAGLASQYVVIPLLYLPFEQIFPSVRHRLETPAQPVLGSHCHRDLGKQPLRLGHVAGMRVVLRIGVVVGQQ